MGCIVNGIGEMADADYGYVGAGPGKVSLYRNRELVSRALPEEEAVDRLVELIKESGDWVDAE
jgi:(E)-4-hydroxy-3-methylbut-2-enyl-diphosphate synthase